MREGVKSMLSKLKSISIKQRLIFVLIIVIAIQCFIFLAFIDFANLYEKFDENTISGIEQTVRGNKNALQSQMASYWSDIDLSEQSLGNLVGNELSSKAKSFGELKSDTELTQSILVNSSGTLKNIIQSNGVTGAFFILNTKEGAGSVSKRPGIYLRKTTADDTLDSELSLIVGPKEWVKNSDIAVSDTWSENFDFTDASANYDFYNKPASSETLLYSVKADEFEYWSAPFELCGRRVITYSIPVINSSKELYGVLGVEISEDYLKAFLPYSGISAGGNNAYILSCASINDTTYDNKVFSGTLFSSDYDENKLADFTYLSEYSKGENTYRILNNGESTNAYAFIYPMNVYTSGSYYAKEQWTLIGIADSSGVTQFSDMVKNQINKAIFVSVLVTLLFGIFANQFITKPISKLNQSIKNIDGIKPVILEKTNYPEIDNLSSALELYSKKLWNSSAKMSKIIDLINIPLATYEISKATGKVTVSKSISNLLSINPAVVNDGCIDSKNWEELYSELTNPINFSYEGAYHINKNKEDEKWIKIESYENDDSIIGVLIDVTGEIKERKRTEYERDYDMLSGLMNRHSFFSFVDQIIQKKDEFNGALVMWNIDNLKSVNSNYGHFVGDKYITETSKVFESVSKPESVCCGRLSGDEFVTFLYGCDSKEGYRAKIAEIYDRLVSLNFVTQNGEKINMKITAGLAFFPENGRSSKELVKRADFAMFQPIGSDRREIYEISEEDVSEKVLHTEQINI